MTTLGLVTARGGSKSIPRKNLALVAGRPLIGWTIDAARRARNLDRLIVSTDDPEIAAFAVREGAEVPFLRPAALAQDDSPHIAVVEHALEWIFENESFVPEWIFTLQPTSPLRTSDDIDAAIALAAKERPDAVISVTPSRQHPLLAKRLRENGTLGDFVSCEIAYRRRQVLPPAYALNGAVFLNRTKALFAEQTMFPEHTIPYVMPESRSLDIDEPWDLELAGMLLAAQTVGVEG